ncbi:MAG: alpha/beta hydrolase [Trueperella sp.]|uniref:alpha/beta hydrolase family protein n=1 Tax=Trueperella sp. TaxID=2699835 RepID=UPI0025F43FFF|nr:alpha/beta hydrolase [Trueperella sp.]MCI7304893.1 alpha/beta hydrolase [Trueperella sp.]MDY5403113.1 alpha/beta hydrolase [Trueperella sp.]
MESRHTGLSLREEQAVQWLTALPVVPDRVETYGDSPAQVIEWYGDPAGQPVCLVHGAIFDNALAATRPAARALARAGYCVGLVDYRRVDSRPELTAHDYTTLGMHPVLGQAVWVGHDVGGTFAMNVTLAPETGVRAAILLAPILDLARDVHEAGEGATTARWIGGTPERVPDRYAIYDPLFAYYQVGPARFRSRELTVDIIHGVDDTLVPVDRSRELRAEPFNLAVVEGADHLDLIRPDRDAWVFLLGALAAQEQ